MNLKKIALLSTVLAISVTNAKADSVYNFDGEAMNYRQSVNLMSDELIRSADESILKTIRDFQGKFSEDKSVLMLAEIDMYGRNYTIADRKLDYFIRNRANSPFVPIAALMRGYMAFQSKEYNKADGLLATAKVLAKKEFASRSDSSYNNIAHNAVFWQAVSLFHQGKFTDAQPVFEECYRDYPDGIYADDALFALGLSAEINKNYDQAITYYKTLTKKHPYSNNYVSARIREANNYLILRDPTNAIIALDNALTVLNRIATKTDDGAKFEVQTNVESAAEEALYLKAEAYNIAGNTSVAESHYSQFIETYPNSRMINYARHGLAWVCLETGKYEKALYYYDQIISGGDEINVKLIASAQMFRAITLKKQGNSQQAKKELSSLVVQPDFPMLGEALFELGLINYELEDYDNSLRNLQRAERESGDAQLIIKIKMLLGANYFEQRKWQMAYDEYKQAEQLAQKSNELFLVKKNWFLAEARLKQGIALVNNARYKEAIPPLQAFIADNKNDSRLDEAIFWMSEAYYRSDMLNNAIENYQNILRRFPDSQRQEESLYGLGWSYFRLKRFKESSETFDKMIKAFPTSKYGVEVLARQGDGYYVLKQFSKAIESYQRALKLDAKGEDALYCSYQICHAYYKMGSFDPAITQLMAFVKKYPNSAYSDNALYLVGWIRFQQKNYSESIDNFRFMIDVYPSSPLIVQARYAIGDAYYNLEKYEAAITAYKEIVEKYPSNPLAGEALRSMQFCLESLGRTDEALRITDTFIASNPGSPYAEEFAFKKGELFYSGKKFGDAISEYNSFIKQYPESEKSAEAMYWMAKSFMSMNDTVNTIKSFSEVVSKYPKSEFAPLSLLENASYQKSINNIVKSEELFDEMRRKYPDNPGAAQAGFEISSSRIALGDTTKAIKVLREVMDKYPDNEYADQSRYRVAMYFKLRNENDSALIHFNLLSKSEFNYALAAEAQYRIGEIRLQENNTKAAIEAFSIVKDKFAGVEDWYSLSMLNLGECYEKIEEFKLAKDIYGALLALRPDDEYGAEAARRLKNIENK